MWHEGTIGIPVKDGSMKAAHYLVKAFEEGSRFGINGGRISKMMIKIDEKVTLNYDRGWEVEPDEKDEMTMLAYCILLQEYN